MSSRALPGMPLSADDVFVCSIPDGGTPPPALRSVVVHPGRRPLTGVWLVLAACGKCTASQYCRWHYPLTSAENMARRQ